MLENYIKEVDDIELVTSFADGFEAYKYLKDNPIPLLFVDIQTPRLKGNELPASLPYEPCIIFTTAYSEYALESFEYNTIDYLTKPISFSRFLKAVTKASQFLGDDTTGEARQEESSSSAQQTPIDHLFLKLNHYYKKIELKDILWIEAIGDYQKLITEDNVYFYYSTLTELAEKLPSDQFLRVHQSYLVNLHKIDGFQGNRLFIKDNVVVIGRSYRDKVKQILGLEG